MRPEFVVALAEFLMTIIGTMAIVNCSIALYKDTKWKRNVQRHRYFSLFNKNNNEKSAMSMMRDPFNQIVVLIFITPTVLHLLCHILMTLVRRYDYDMDEIELETPSEEPDILNYSSTALMTPPLEHVPEHDKRSGDLTPVSLSQNNSMTNRFSITNPMSDYEKQKGKTARHQTSTWPDQNFGTNENNSFRRHSVSQPNYSKNTDTDTGTKKVSESDPVKTDITRKSTITFQDEIFNIENIDQVNDLPINSETIPTPIEQEFDDTDMPFFNPRMCKLLLLATILFESLTAFAACYYQVDVAVRYRNNTKAQLPNETDTNAFIGAILLASCNDNDLLHRNVSLIQRRDHLYVCQDTRAKVWSASMCFLLGVSGLLSIIVIYWQFSESLAFRDSSNYAAYRQFQMKQLKFHRNHHHHFSDKASVSQLSTTDSIEDKYNRLQYDHGQAEDDKAFKPYTVMS